MVAHSEILLSKCAQFREQGEFIDVRLKVSEDVFPAHRIVLAANSDYFHAMFAHGMKESNQEVIELKDENISAAALKIVMDSIYSGELHVEDENVFEVLLAADHLQVTCVVQQCCNYLLREFVQARFDVQTYCRICTIADRHGLTDLQEAAERKMASMYKEICESEEFLSHMDIDQLSSLLRRDDLSASSETFVLKSVMQWIKYKKEERIAVAAKVVGAVRLGQVDIRDVIEELNTDEMQRVAEIHMLVYETFLHNYRPLNSSKFAAEKTKPRSMNPVLVAILPQTQMQYFDVQSKTWKPLPSMAQLTEATECFCAEPCGNYLYVATKKGGNYVIYRYHTVSNMWETLPRFFGSANQTDCLCCVEDHIFAIYQSVAPHRYSVSTNQWQCVAKLDATCHMMKETFCNKAAVVFRSCIYVIHGQAVNNVNTSGFNFGSPAASGISLGSVEAPVTGLFGTLVTASGTRPFGTGSLFGSVPTSGTNFGSEPASGSLSGNSGDTQPQRNWQPKVAKVYCFDPKRNKWEQRASTSQSHYASSLFVVNDKLCVAGGKCSIHPSTGKPHDFTASVVEVYDEEKNTWSVVEQNHIPPNNLGAVEIEGRVYFIINSFPLDSGIRIPPGDVYAVSLDEWENLGYIDRNAVLCYVPVKKDNLTAEHT